MQDYYAFLEVSPNATRAEIQRAYRRLARRYHPDLNSSERDIHIKRLNEAYAVLRDPLKRAEYDAQLAEARRRASLEAEWRRQQEQKKREPEMTWVEGLFGFVNELKKGLNEE